LTSHSRCGDFWYKSFASFGLADEQRMPPISSSVDFEALVESHVILDALRSS
jgi:hypothetical protein